MSNQIFRKKSMDRISSPEELNDYVKVSNPSIWILLIAIVILLAGICAWGILGRIETKIDVAAISDGNGTFCYVKESKIKSVQEDMIVDIDGKQYRVSSIAEKPIEVDENIDEYSRHVGDLVVGEWVYRVEINADLIQGVYEASIIIESISPMSFITN